MKIPVLLLIASFLSLHVSAQHKALLQGDVVGRNSDTLWLFPKVASTRQEDKIIKIPIVNNKFSYELNAEEVQAYQLVFLDERMKGAWQSIIFFPDTAKIEFTLYEMNRSEENVIKGGEINRSYYALKAKEKERFKTSRDLINKRITELVDAGNYYSAADREIMTNIKGKSGADAVKFYEQRELLIKKGLDLTPEGLKLRESSDSLDNVMYKWRYALIEKNITIDNFYQIWFDTRAQAKENRNLAFLVNKVYPVFAAKFPASIYTKLVGDELSGIVQIFPGNKFIDFTAPTLAGEQVNLAKTINGKVALIDLWGSWCGPCIGKAREIVPIYKKYKDKGFTVVGVAREFKDTAELVARLKQEEFSWTNLVELDDKNEIWNKYSAGDGGGMQVLVDQAGTVLVVNPTAEEVESYVRKLLG